MNRGTTYYYSEFRNYQGNNYYLVYDSNGNLFDSIFRSCAAADKLYIEEMEDKYGANNLKKLDKPPMSLIVPNNWEEKAMKAWALAVDERSAETASVTIDCVAENKVKTEFKRFNLIKNDIAQIEGVMWSDGRVTCTWIQKNIKADWSRVGGPPFYQYVAIEELFDMYSEPTWKFVWIDDRRKDMAVRNLIDNQEIRVQKAISALNNEYTALRNRLKVSD